MFQIGGADLQNRRTPALGGVTETVKIFRCIYIMTRFLNSSQFQKASIELKK